MKKLFTLLTLCAMLCAFSPHLDAQSSWLNQVGLLDDFLPLENFVTTTKTTYGIREIETVTWVSGKPKYSYTYEQYSTDAVFTACVLNYLEHCVNEYKIPLTLNQGGELVLYRATFSATTQVGPYAGQTYLHGWEERNIVPTPTGYDIIASAYPYMNAEQNGLPAVKPWMWIQRKTVSTINGKTYTTTSTKKILKDDIEARTGLTEEQLGYQTRIVYHCKAVDPAKYITSIFGLVEKQGNTYYNKSLINGQDWHTQITKGLIQPFGKVLSPMKFSWVVYNGCSTGTAPQGAVGWGMFHGNFGECYRYMSDATSSYSDYITIVNGASFIANQAGTVTVNSTQPCILEIVPAWTPAPEKNTAESGYFNINTGQPVFSLY